MNKEKNIGIILALLIIIVIVAFIIISLLSKPEFYVTFNTNGGSKIAEVEVKAKEKIERPEDPVREGYKFIGWYLDDEKFDFNSPITKSITLVAKWEQIKQNQVTLSFDSLGGSEVNDITINAGSVLSNIPNPTREDYLFVAWYYQNKEFDFATPISEDMTFVAKWKKDNTPKYEITFDSDGGSEVASIVVRENTVVSQPNIPTKKGYKFVAWYLDDEEFDFTTLITKNLTLTAKWEKE